MIKLLKNQPKPLKKPSKSIPVVFKRIALLTLTVIMLVATSIVVIPPQTAQAQASTTLPKCDTTALQPSWLDMLYPTNNGSQVDTGAMLFQRSTYGADMTEGQMYLLIGTQDSTLNNWADDGFGFTQSTVYRIENGVPTTPLHNGYGYYEFRASCVSGLSDFYYTSEGRTYHRTFPPYNNNVWNGVMVKDASTGNEPPVSGAVPFPECNLSYNFHMQDAGQSDIYGLFRSYAQKNYPDDYQLLQDFDPTSSVIIFGTTAELVALGSIAKGHPAWNDIENYPNFRILYASDHGKLTMQPDRSVTSTTPIKMITFVDMPKGFKTYQATLANPLYTELPPAQTEAQENYFDARAYNYAGTPNTTYNFVSDDSTINAGCMSNNINVDYHPDYQYDKLDDELMTLPEDYEKECNLTDILCHIAKIGKNIGGAISGLAKELLAGISWLFVPDAKFMTGFFNETKAQLEGKLGFIYYALTSIGQFFGTFINASQAGCTQNGCVRSFGQLYGRNLSVDFATVAKTMPELWTYCVLFIRGVIIIAFLLLTRRQILRMLSDY